MRAGPGYQAVLPTCSSKPGPDRRPSADEASWLQHFVMNAGRYGRPDQPMPVRLVMETEAHQR